MFSFEIRGSINSLLVVFSGVVWLRKKASVVWGKPDEWVVLYARTQNVLESTESSDSLEPIVSIQSIEPIESTVLAQADFKQMRFPIFGSIILMFSFFYIV